MKPKILIIDDERNTRDGLKLALEDNYQIFLAENALRGLEILQRETVDIVLTDLRMPGLDGMDFLKQVVKQENAPLVILLTAYGSIQTSLEAMAAGAYDYISKPVDIDNLEAIIARGLNSRTSPSDETEPREEMIAASPAMKAVMEAVHQVASTHATVLITGESGTGKEVIAQALHRLSAHASAPFIPVHCAALNENLLESELFGHEKGAYTGADGKSIGRFEAAADGTIFLDEIGEITPATQVKLLRVLENRSFERVGGNKSIPIQARIVAATNRDLSRMVAEGTFREDLFYRLNVVTIHLPPLRARKEDIAPLLEFFLRKANSENNRNITGISPDAMKLLEVYQWPGNIREVRNCVERMVVFAKGAILTMNDIPREILESVSRQFSPDSRQTAEPGEEISVQSPATSKPPVLSQPPQPENTAEEKNEAEIQPQKKTANGLNVKEHEKTLILTALETCGGNRTKAAETLGISRRTLQRKLHEFGLQ